MVELWTIHVEIAKESSILRQCVSQSRIEKSELVCSSNSSALGFPKHLGTATLRKCAALVYVFPFTLHENRGCYPEPLFAYSASCQRFVASFFEEYHRAVIVDVLPPAHRLLSLRSLIKVSVSPLIPKFIMLMGTAIPIAILTYCKYTKSFSLTNIAKKGLDIVWVSWGYPRLCLRRARSTIQMTQDHDWREGI